MSTDDHGPTHPNGLTEDTDIATRGHALPHEASTMTAPNPDPPSIVAPHSDHVSDNGVADHASVAPDMHLIPQTVSLHSETQAELDHEDAAKSAGNGHHAESEGTDDEEGEDEGDEYDDEDEDEDDDEDEDVEPTLKYERFGGAFHDLLKKDSASALVVSNKFLVLDAILICWSPLTLSCRRSVRTMDLHISWI